MGNILGPHCAAQLPGDDGAREAVQHGRRIYPVPSDDREIDEVSLPHLVRTHGLGVEAIRRPDHDLGWTGDQVMGLQQAANRRFQYEVALLVGEPYGQLPGRQLRLIQRQFDDVVMDISQDAVPHPAPCQWSILQRFRAALELAGRPWLPRPLPPTPLPLCKPLTLKPKGPTSDRYR